MSTNNDEAIRRLRQAGKDKQMWGLLSYFLPPFIVIFLPLWLLAIRREKRLIRTIAGQIGVPDHTSDKDMRSAVGDHLRDDSITKNSYGPWVVAAVILGVSVFVIIQIIINNT